MPARNYGIDSEGVSEIPDKKKNDFRKMSNHLYRYQLLETHQTVIKLTILNQPHHFKQVITCHAQCHLWLPRKLVWQFHQIQILTCNFDWAKEGSLTMSYWKIIGVSVLTNVY